METFVTVLHIVVALILITLVLLQDTKSGSVGGAFGGGGSSSVLGATGATTLAQQLTRGTAVVFAVTSILLSVFAARSQRSVVDALAPTPAQAAPAEGATTTSTPVTAPNEPAGSPIPAKAATPAPDAVATPAAPAK
jgi:preprotein translocase subunit SecG